MIPLLIIILIIAITVAVILGLLVKLLKPTPGPYTYKKIPYLFTKTEKKFLDVLEKTIGSEYKIMGKVRISDIIKPCRTGDRSEWQRAFNKITSKHIDFVICDPESLKIKFCIELDDSSHNRPERIKRDLFVNAAFKNANVKLFRIKTQKDPENYKRNLEEIYIFISK